MLTVTFCSSFLLLDFYFEVAEQKSRKNKNLHIENEQMLWYTVFSYRGYNMNNLVKDEINIEDLIYEIRGV